MTAELDFPALGDKENRIMVKSIGETAAAAAHLGTQAGGRGRGVVLSECSFHRINLYSSVKGERVLRVTRWHLRNGFSTVQGFPGWELTAGWPTAAGAAAPGRSVRK